MIIFVNFACTFFPGPVLALPAPSADEPANTEPGGEVDEEGEDVVMES